MTEESRTKMSVADKGRVPWNRGIPRTDEERAKMSTAHMGISHPHMGVPLSDGARAKVSAAQMGHTTSLETRARISVSNWKGGPRVSIPKENARRRGLGYVYLNPWFAGCEGHHVSNELVINMPKALHRSIYHRQSDGRGMAAMNAVAYNFLFKQEVEAALVVANE